MKLKFLKLILPCFASLACLAGCGNDGPVDPDDPDNVKKYYAKYDLTLRGPKLEKELQKLCFKTHTVFPKYSQYYTYTAFADDHISSEAAPSTVKYDTDGKIDYAKSKKSGKNEYFYTGKIASGVGTREHVWPCANSGGLWVHEKDAGAHYVDGSKYAGAGSDLYHIRPSTGNVNTARGNSKFVDFDDPEFAAIRSGVAVVGDTGTYKLKIQGYEETDSGVKQFAQKAEVADEFKGDVARILVYVWIHYSYRGEYYDHPDMIGSLDLCNVLGYGSDLDRVHEKLCDWNEMDPPSETEKLRNDTVQRMQGNRNPLVDHPELMEQLFF